ncbi:hypothetical protein PT974_02403 [Cladobotryum mycophilum]|uniref:F-box domain-containing protein n=1 Tax=Cladobotryum mycophilum TaxID=491253 RepID=A0ABR0SYU4_9HYPO
MEQSTLILEKIRDLTYPCYRLNDHTLDENLPVFPDPPANNSRRPPPIRDIGVLGALPPELLQDVLYELDLRTLKNFRYVNRRAAELDYLQNVIREAMRIRIKSYLPLRPQHAYRKFGLNRHIVETLPRMSAIPGIYSPNEKKATRCVLVDYDSARCAGISLYGSLEAMENYVSDRAEQKHQEYLGKVAAAHESGSSTRHLRTPPAMDPFDGCSGNPHRFVAITRVPWLNEVSREVERGFHCVGCERLSRPPLHYRRKFTSASFIAHLEQCGDIKNGKHPDSG